MQTALCCVPGPELASTRHTGNGPAPTLQEQAKGRTNAKGREMCVSVCVSVSVSVSVFGYAKGKRT